MKRALAILLFIAAPAAADPKPAEPKAAETKAAPAPATCKKTVVGKGLDRHTVCSIDREIVVKLETPKPKVLIIHQGGRSVTGRPRSEDRLEGLSHQR